MLGPTSLTKSFGGALPPKRNSPLDQTPSSLLSLIRTNSPLDKKESPPRQFPSSMEPLNIQDFESLFDDEPISEKREEKINQPLSPERLEEIPVTFRDLQMLENARGVDWERVFNDCF